MAKFYGVNPGATKDIDLNHFVGQRPQTVPVEQSERQSAAIVS
jgi:hypothetical protein